MLSMLRVHRALFLLVPLVMIVPETAVAENQVYLLNCRLMDRASLVYKRYCIGEIGLQQRCPDRRRCIPQIAVRVITNFHSQYNQAGEAGSNSGVTNTAASTPGVAGTVADSSVSDGAISATGVAGQAGGAVSAASGITGQVDSAASSASGVVGGVTSGVTGAVSGALGTVGGLQ